MAAGLFCTGIFVPCWGGPLNETAYPPMAKSSGPNVGGMGVTASWGIGIAERLLPEIIDVLVLPPSQNLVGNVCFP